MLVGAPRPRLVGRGTAATYAAPIRVAGVPIVVEALVVMDGCEITDSISFTAFAS